VSPGNKNGKKDRMIAMATFGGALMVAGITINYTVEDLGPVVFGRVIAVIGFLFVLWALYGFLKVEDKSTYK
jgi:hypothetical protein